MALLDRPLFVGAHADDVELFAGGTIARCGSDSAVLVFSRHRGICESPPHEFYDSMATLGVARERTGLYDLPACQNPPDDFQAHHDFIYRTMEEFRLRYAPTVVVTHQSTDTNQDHQFIHKVALRVFKKHCSIICGEFPPNDLPRADRRMLVSIGEEGVRRKKSALQCYDSQRREGRDYFDPYLIHARAAVHGREMGALYAEAFEVIQLWV